MADLLLSLVALALRVAFLPLLIEAIPAGMTVVVMVGAAVAAAPAALELAVGRRIPPVIHAAIAAAAFTETVGRSQRLYEGHPVAYDLLAHAVEVGALVAVMLVLTAGMRSGRGATPGPVLLLAILIGTTAAVGWELVEAAIDPLLPGTLQHGLDDTVGDIVAGLAGAAIAATVLVHRLPTAVGVAEVQPPPG